jgi:hypothetical protein
VRFRAPLQLTLLVTNYDKTRADEEIAFNDMIQLGRTSRKLTDFWEMNLLAVNGQQ